MLRANEPQGFSPDFPLKNRRKPEGIRETIALE
jgi:hypothetical protein